MVNFEKILDIFPDIFPREDDSTLARYTKAHEDEAEQFGVELDKVRESRFLNKASGDDLDRIGAMFGPLGDRNGRTDQEYRVYLKTIVQAYKGAGTVPAIIAAVSAGLGVKEKNIRVNEHYQDLEYTIVLDDWDEPHKLSTAHQLAELADASVSDMRSLKYKVGKEPTATSDSLTIKPGLSVGDDMYSFDGLSVNPNKTNVGEDLYISDSVAMPVWRFTEEMYNFDAVGIDPDKTNVSDEVYATDTAEERTQRFTEGTYAADPTNVSAFKSGEAKWEEPNWFGILGGFNGDIEILGSTDGFDLVGKADATANTGYEDIFTEQFTTDDFDESDGQTDIYLAFAAKWNEIPIWGAEGTWVKKPAPDPDKYQLYILKNDGQNSRDEYFRLYYSTNNDTAVGRIADPVVWTEGKYNDARITGDKSDRAVERVHDTKWQFFAWGEVRDENYNYQDELYGYDSVGVDPNKTTTGDEMYGHDGVSVDPNKTTTGDEMYTSDVVYDVDTRAARKNRWEKQDWGFMAWADIKEIYRSSTDTGYGYDGVYIDPNTHTVPDEMYGYDGVTINGNNPNVPDEMYASDTVTTSSRANTNQEWDTHNWGFIAWT